MKIPSRRDFLRLSGMGAAALLTSDVETLLRNETPSKTEIPRATEVDAEFPAANAFVADVEIALWATPSEVQILPDKPTRVWTYHGAVLQGDPATLQPLAGTYLGPVIRVRKGQNVRLNFTNELSEQSIIHWHGLHVPEQMDGHPRYAINSGQTYVYEFTINDRAGTYWYHPHPHRRTGPQVNYGLAGFFLVSDDEEAALGLPLGEYDVPLVIQDRTFDANNQLVYQSGGMMGGVTGFLGDRILVNGHPNYALPVATRAYRLRLLNGSNARIYKLAWEDGTPLTVIGTDGGLLEAPVQRNYVTWSPGERIDLWVDFNGRAVGTEMVLRSLSFNAGMMGGNGVLPNGAPFPVLKVRVDREESDSSPLPDRLSTFERYRTADAVNYQSPCTFNLSMRGMMTWTINGRVFEMTGVANNEIVQLNTLEMWKFANTSTMPHPMHIHGLQFQVLQRQVTQQGSAAWETVRVGYVDDGWKDTVLVMPGEQVTLLMKFKDYPGMFLYHCHNLEHEDMGMMRNYLIRGLTTSVETGETNSVAPAGYALLPNYPNPFNPETVIRFQIPVPEEVTLKIIDAQGHAVKTLAQGFRQAGIHAVVWNGSNDHGTEVSSGVYLIVFKTRKFTDARKITLLR